MHKYNDGAPQESPVETQSHLLEDFEAVAARLRIKDMGGRKNSPQTAHTVDEEYQSYINGTLTKQGENPLKFWDVRSGLSALNN